MLFPPLPYAHLLLSIAALSDSQQLLVSALNGLSDSPASQRSDRSGAVGAGACSVRSNASALSTPRSVYYEAPSSEAGSSAHSVPRGVFPIDSDDSQRSASCTPASQQNEIARSTDALARQQQQQQHGGDVGVGFGARLDASAVEAEEESATAASQSAAAAVAAATPCTSSTVAIGAHAAVTLATSTTSTSTSTTAVTTADDDDDDLQEFDPFLFIKLLPPRSDVPLRPRLPPKRNGSPRATLVLDLDETLVHCSTERMPGADFQFPVVFNGVEYQVYARRRPGFEAFLDRVAELFETVVFTASQQVRLRSPLRHFCC